MPERRLRPGINASDKVNKLDYPAEVFYRRLMSEVDDYGLYDARPAILRSKLYPLRVDCIREADISRWLIACQNAGLIVLYEIDGQPLLVMHKVGKARALVPMYAPPPWFPKDVLRAYADVRAQMRADGPYSYSSSYSSSINPPTPPRGGGRMAGARKERPPRPPRKNATSELERLKRRDGVK